MCFSLFHSQGLNILVCLLSLFCVCQAKNEVHLVENEIHLLFNWFDLRRHSSHRILKRQPFQLWLFAWVNILFWSLFFSATKEKLFKIKHFVYSLSLFCWFAFLFGLSHFSKRRMSLNYFSILFISFVSHLWFR